VVAIEPELLRLLLYLLAVVLVQGLFELLLDYLVALLSWFVPQVGNRTVAELRTRMGSLAFSLHEGRPNADRILSRINSFEEVQAVANGGHFFLQRVVGLDAHLLRRGLYLVG